MPLAPLSIKSMISQHQIFGQKTNPIYFLRHYIYILYYILYFYIFFYEFINLFGYKYNDL